MQPGKNIAANIDMPIALLPSLLLQILVVGYTPGPANIYALAMSLKHGRRRSLVMWLGLLAGFSVAVTVTAVLAHFIGVEFSAGIGYLKYIGAAYILFLALRMWRNRGVAREKDGGECSFASGMIVQMTNAKMLLFDLTAFSTFVLPYSNSLADLLTVAAWLLLAGPGANLLWLLAGAYLRRFFAGHQRQTAAVCAAALALCAAYIVFSSK